MQKIVGVLLALFISVSVFAQQYNFIDYSIEEGLAQSQVRAICQDNSGYIWVGTLGGLSKFDGINFENFSVKDGLLTNQINSIYKDSKGNLWLGTLGGVSFYDGNKFKSYQFKEELAENTVLSIVEDRIGNIWFATDGGGVVYFNQEEFNYITLKNGTDNNYVRNIISDDKGSVWLATRNGITTIDLNFNVKNIVEDINATQVCLDNEEIWCSTFGDGIVKVVDGEQMILNVDSGLISNHIRGFVKRSDGSIWFVSKNGISKYFNGKFKNFTTADGLKDHNVKCTTEDCEGNLFLGTDGGGLIKFTSEDFVSYTENDVVGSNVVMSVLQDQNTNIWVSTYGEGIGVFTSKGYSRFTTANGLGNNTVWCSLVSSDLNLWVGTSNGVSVFNGTSFKTYNQKHGLEGKKVWSLAEDETGKIWIGTKEGVSLIDPKTAKISNLGVGRNVRTIFKDTDNYFWFCSSDGLFKYNVQTQNYKLYSSGDGLPSESVMNIVKDDNGVYWIGTTNGLAVMKDGEITAIDVPGNFSANNINFLQLDDFNNLWIGTNFGLYQLNIKDKTKFVATDFIRYSNLDGLKSLECNQNASYIDNQNNLWFGTSYGLMKHRLKPDKEKISYPKVQLKGVRLFFEDFDFSKYSDGYIGNTELPNNLQLKYNKNHLTFDFVGIYLTNPDKVTYRFKLEGFDEDWHPITASRFVTYSNIPSGSFTFKLIASTDRENWSTPQEFTFIIDPPFWFTWWFFMLSLLFVSGLVFLIFLRIKRTKLAKQATQLLQDKTKMLSLEQQALNASMNRHFIFNALNSIQFYINRQDKISANKYLSSFAKLVRKNLDSSLVAEIALEDEIERIKLYLNLEQMRFQNKFNYDINIDSNIDTQSIMIPSMLLQPFIENSIWHGILPSNTPGNIVVNVKLERDKLYINVTDDGVGIDVSIEQKRGKTQHHDSKGMELTKGRIKLISKISNKDCAIKGPYQVYSATNKVAGTEVVIILTL